MAPRLTDKQIKKIVADYAEQENYSAVARMNNVSRNTVKSVILTNGEIAAKCQQKKEENTVDMFAYMDSRKKQAQSVIDIYLAALADPDKLNEATLSQIATALGIIVDKFTKGAIANNSEIEDLTPLAEMLKK